MNRMVVTMGLTALAVWIGANGCGGGGGHTSSDAHDSEITDGPSKKDAARVDGAGGHSDAKPGSDAKVDAPQPGRDGAAGGGGHDASPDGSSPRRDGAADLAADAPVARDAAVDAPPLTFIVDATQNVIELDACGGITPASFADVSPGSYTLTLTTSNLSKGGTTGSPDTNNPIPSVDNYVVVNLPLPIGDPQSANRFFMLNGIGASADFTLPDMGTIGVMFIDSDNTANSGQGTVTLDPGALTATVDATANVIPWQSGCMSSSADLEVPDGLQRITLVASTLSDGAGSQDDYVIVRVPDETPSNDHRYVILNGLGASFDFTPFNNHTIKAWFIASGPGATGQATLSVTNL